MQNVVGAGYRRKKLNDYGLVGCCVRWVQVPEMYKLMRGSFANTVSCISAEVGNEGKYVIYVK
jgi:hypothetical protein